MSLFDKLKEKTQASTPQPQASSGFSIMDKLRALGDEQQVNPPTPPAEPAPEVAPEAPPAVAEPEGEGVACPTCGKVFKHLSRHKCKGPDESKPTTALARTLFSSDLESASVSTPAPELPKFESGKTSLTVMFDALFEKSDGPAPLLLGDILVPLAAAVAKENGQPHWSAVDYGKGAGFLAAKLQQWLVQTSFAGTILVDSSTPEARAVKEVLRRAAGTIIQGVR